MGFDTKVLTGSLKHGLDFGRFFLKMSSQTLFPHELIPRHICGLLVSSLMSWFFCRTLWDAEEVSSRTNLRNFCGCCSINAKRTSFQSLVISSRPHLSEDRALVSLQSLCLQSVQLRCGPCAPAQTNRNNFGQLWHPRVNDLGK